MNDNRYTQDGEELILSLYFNAIGFGFVLMKNPLEVIEKGMICITPIDNTEVLKKVKHLIRRLKPKRIIIEDHTGNYSNKSKRVVEVLKAIQKYSNQKGLKLSSYSREQIRLVFSNWHAESRYEINRNILKPNILEVLNLTLLLSVLLIIILKIKHFS